MTSSFQEVKAIKEVIPNLDILQRSALVRFQENFGIQNATVVGCFAPINNNYFNSQFYVFVNFFFNFIN